LEEFLNIRFESKSEYEWENEAILDLLQYISKEKNVTNPITINRIKEGVSKSPDFYTQGYDSLIEIKRISEEREIFPYTKCDILGELEEKILPKIKGLNQQITVLLYANSALKNRGKEYHKLISGIINDINQDRDTGSVFDYYYSIKKKHKEKENNSLFVIFNNFKMISSESLFPIISPLISKSINQLNEPQTYTSQPSKNILLLDNFLPYPIHIETIKQAILKSLGETVNASKLDGVYLRMNHQIYIIK
jgi:hypothetical protein